MCATEDYERLAKLVMAVKERGIWTCEFGVCYPMEAPDKNYSDDAKETGMRRWWKYMAPLN